MVEARLGLRSTMSIEANKKKSKCVTGLLVFGRLAIGAAAVHRL